MTARDCDLGLVGLGVMGRNFLLNVADNGFSAVGFDKNDQQTKALKDESGGQEVYATESIKEMVEMVRKPRAVMMLVPAGDAVDSVLKDLRPCLEAGDVVIDAGNSHFKDTDRRASRLAEEGIHYLGVGVSGGAEGARHGPSIMPGGPREAYERIRDVFEAAAAHLDDDPCVAWLGPGSAGHYVKMVHNGIEYGVMQLIAECYDVMKRMLGMGNDQMHEVFARWNTGRMESFLLEITADIFMKKDEETDNRLLDMVLDEAGHKGTGMWTSESTLELHVPAPTIDMAVVMRDLSTYKNQRQEEKRIAQGPDPRYEGDRSQFLECLQNAFRTCVIETYAQGMAVLHQASEAREYGLDLATVARIWRGGCIIRSALLEDLRQVFADCPDLPDLLLDERFARELAEHQQDLRHVVVTTAQRGIPTPAMMSSLAYFDSYRSEWLPANLIQAQRDYFGWHTYKRVDREGTFHTNWSEVEAHQR